MNDQQAAEYVAGIESKIQAVRWELTVDLAIAAAFARDVPQHPGALPFDDLTISGDHRPRHGRLYARGNG